MAYGHAERNLALIRQLEAETASLRDQQGGLDAAQSTWLEGADSDIAHAPPHDQETQAVVGQPTEAGIDRARPPQWAGPSRVTSP